MAFNPLRIALVADIHANIWALDAVLAHIQKQRVDTVFKKGIGFDPAKLIASVKGQAGIW